VTGTGSAFTKAAFESAAASLGRIGYVDNVTAPWITGTGNINAPGGNGNRDYYMSSDGNHLDHAGVDYFADLAAHTVFAKLAELAV
jgi:hypothetical protein